jgi:DNA-directed RNA polymerase specialized sigma24 family protein
MRTQGKRDVVREDVSLGKVGRDLARTGLSKRSTIPGNHDPLYLFACHLDWQYRRTLAAYQRLVSALDDSDIRIREIAEMLVHRSFPVRRGKAEAFIESKRSIMEWFHSTEREQERPNGGLASSHEIQSAFDEQREYLYWIALLITGDQALANQAVVNASALSANYSSAFRDWLNGWAKYATVRAAVREVRDLILASACQSVDSSSEHHDDDVLSDDQIMLLRRADPQEIIAALDPLARCALVLRGIQHASLADCALLLDVSRGILPEPTPMRCDGMLNT